MARDKSLTVVEERILSMALLSGLTGRDLQRLGGRLERHRKLEEKQQQIDAEIAGWQFSEDELGRIVQSPDGSCYIVQESQSSSTNRVIKFDSNGEAEKRADFTCGHWYEYEFPKRLYPLKSRVLYRAVVLIKTDFLEWKRATRGIKIAVDKG